MSDKYIEVGEEVERGVNLALKKALTEVMAACTANPHIKLHGLSIRLYYGNCCVGVIGESGLLQKIEQDMRDSGQTLRTEHIHASEIVPIDLMPRDPDERGN